MAKTSIKPPVKKNPVHVTWKNMLFHILQIKGYEKQMYKFVLNVQKI